MTRPTFAQALGMPGQKLLAGILSLQDENGVSFSDSVLGAGTAVIGKIAVAAKSAATGDTEIDAITVGADGTTNTTNRLAVSDHLKIFNGTTWDRFRTAVSDAMAATGLAASGLMGFNGATWDRLKATSGVLHTLAKATAGTATAHRSAVTAADVIAAPGTVTCTKIAGGAATAGVYSVVVVAGNTYGRTTGVNGNVQVTTETTNLTVRAAFAQVTGATFYDIYCSVASAGAALFLGRVTETQRATGCTITAQNTTGAGGTAGAVDCQFPGTGLAANAGQNAQNTAHTPEGLTGIDPSGAQNLDFNISFSRTGDSVAGALTVIPFYLGSGSHYWAGDPVTLTFGGASGSYYPLRQTFRAPCRGRTTVVVVAAIAGTGASVDIESVAN